MAIEVGSQNPLDLRRALPRIPPGDQLARASTSFMSMAPSSTLKSLRGKRDSGQLRPRDRAVHCLMVKRGPFSVSFTSLALPTCHWPPGPLALKRSQSCRHEIGPQQLLWAFSDFSDFSDLEHSNELRPLKGVVPEVDHIAASPHARHGRDSSFSEPFPA